MPTIRTPVAELRPGDLLVPTSRRITRAPSRGVKTPAGKVDLELRRQDGRRQLVTFGARTMVTVEREDVA